MDASEDEGAVQAVVVEASREEVETYACDEDGVVILSDGFTSLVVVVVYFPVYGDEGDSMRLGKSTHNHTTQNLLRL